MTVLPFKQGQPEPGWLYILRDPSRRGYCKVGQTTRDPETRAAELSTGSPHGLTVAHAWEVDDVVLAERNAHAALRRYRVDTGNEWFSLSADAAAAALTGRKPTFSTTRRFHRTRLAVELWGWFSLSLFIWALFQQYGDHL